MGRVGAAGDNAAMESFFATLQNNVLDRRTWGTRDELRAAIPFTGSSGPTIAVDDSGGWVKCPRSNTRLLATMPSLWRHKPLSQLNLQQTLTSVAGMTMVIASMSYQKRK